MRAAPVVDELKSELFWSDFNARFDAELTKRGLTSDDVVDTCWVVERAGWHFGPGRSVAEIARRLRLGDPPPPLFTVMRAKFWLYGDMVEFLGRRKQLR